MSDIEYLNQLEKLFLEYFSESSNEKKRRIEEMLENFFKQFNAWKYCNYFLANSTNENLLNYCLNHFNKLANSMWPGLTVQDRKDLKDFMWEALKTRHKQLSHFICFKLARIIVLIARSDWSHDYSNFFEQVYEISLLPEYSYIGLNMIIEASEELAKPKCDVVSTQRRIQLRNLMEQEVASIVKFLTPLLDHCSKLYLSDLGASTITTQNPNSSYKLCDLILNCLAHVFTWLPISQNPVNTNLIENLFSIAVLGVDGSREMSNNSETLGCSAIIALYELIALGGVPPNFDDFIRHIFTLTYRLLEKIVNLDEGLGKIDDKFLERFTEYLRLFVNNHLKRIINNQQFPILDFLNLLQQYTFKQPQMDSYYQVLEVWHVYFNLVKYLDSSQVEHSGEASVIAKNSFLFQSLIENIISKMQFSTNSEELQDLDDELSETTNNSTATNYYNVKEETYESEWQSFLRQSIEMLAELAELIPEKAFQIICPLFNSYSTEYLGLHASFQSEQVENEENSVFVFNDPTEWQGLYALLKDLRTILQILGRLAEHFCDSLFSVRFQDANYLVTRLLDMINFSIQHSLYKIQINLANTDTSDYPDFTKTLSHMLSTLKAYIPWFSQYHRQAFKEEALMEVLFGYSQKIVHICHTLITKRCSSVLKLCSCDLLLSLAGSVRLSFLFNIKEYQHLLLLACQRQLQLAAQSRILLYRTIVCSYMLPWPDAGEKEQCWDQRGDEFKQFILKFTEDFTNIANNQNIMSNTAIQAQYKPLIPYTLDVLADWSVTIKEENKRIRGILYDSIDTCIDTSLIIFPIYLNDTSILKTILNFFLAIFDSLAAQMGSERIEKITHLLMNSLTKEQIENSINENSSGSIVIEYFLQIMDILSQTMNKSITSFLPQVINFVLEHVFPVVSIQGVTRVKTAVFSLFRSVLLYNWKSYFPSNMFQVANPKDEIIHNKEQFLTIMKILCDYFTEVDITLFRENILALDKINSKNKLFSKYIFVNNMRNSFCAVFLQVIVQQSHELLLDEIVDIVFRIASADFQGFFGTFIPEFLQNCSNLDNKQRSSLHINFKKNEDFPTFKLNLLQLCNDLRFFIVVNTTTPSGSVNLTQT